MPDFNNNNYQNTYLNYLQALTIQIAAYQNELAQLSNISKTRTLTPQETNRYNELFNACNQLLQQKAALLSPQTYAISNQEVYTRTTVTYFTPQGNFMNVVTQQNNGYFSNSYSAQLGLFAAQYSSPQTASYQWSNVRVNNIPMQPNFNFTQQDNTQQTQASTQPNFTQDTNIPPTTSFDLPSTRINTSYASATPVPESTSTPAAKSKSDFHVQPEKNPASFRMVKLIYASDENNNKQRKPK